MKMKKETLLTIENLKVTFGHEPRLVKAVDEISFDIKKGETVALVGESGSGKSVTALSILQLLPYPYARNPKGRIKLKEQELVGASFETMRNIRGKRVSMIFQEPMTSLNPLHSIKKQIAEILEIHQDITGEKAEEKIIELLELVGIPNAKTRLQSLPHELSGGQRQRVMIAMALANNPELLIADEPTTALDVTIQAQILDLMLDLQKKLNMAILLITHDLAIVRKMASRVCVMRHGEIVEKGNVDQIFSNPQHDYTKELMDAIPKGRPDPMNPSAPTVMKGHNIKVWFPIKRGFIKRVIDHIKAVDGIDIEIKEGQTVGVVGESGSGKTTLGMALLRLISSEGKIHLNGSRIDQVSWKALRSKRKQIQMVFQDPYGSLGPRMSIKQIIGEGLLVHEPDLSKAEQTKRIVEALYEVDLDENCLHRYPHEFSGGQRQRISIARAMVLRPKLIVLDEPTSALDMSVQARIVTLLKKLQIKHKLAYIFISHDLKVVRSMSHYIVVMKDGKVVEQGESEAVFEAPRFPYTKALLKAAFELVSDKSGTVRQ